MTEVTIVVMAKSPVPGRSKTRLCPPCTPNEAAALAEAALLDTLAAVGTTPARRRVLALEGDPGPWLPACFEAIPQDGDGLGERLAAALTAAGGPVLVVGMDTPQLTPELLSSAAASLAASDVDAVLGRACDGGYWTIGLERPDGRVFEGVPMSCAVTAAVQLRRLRALGLRVRDLPTLRDVDTIRDARAVAHTCPETRFARALGALRGGARLPDRLLEGHEAGRGAAGL